MRRGILVGLLATALLGLGGCTTTSRLVVGTPSALPSGTPVPPPRPAYDWFYVSPDRRALLIPVTEPTADRSDPCWVGYVAFPVKRGPVIYVLLSGAHPRQSTPAASCPEGDRTRPWYVRVPLSSRYHHEQVEDDGTGFRRTFRGTARIGPGRIVNLHPQP
ncbi:MAG: hypothetical protein ACXVEU_16185 [Nocardioidaceae bacterium]